MFLMGFTVFLFSVVLSGVFLRFFSRVFWSFVCFLSDLFNGCLWWVMPAILLFVLEL